MLKMIVGGPIDPVWAAVALVGLFAMITIIVTSFVIKRRSTLQLNQEFELGKMKLRNEDEQAKRVNDRHREKELAELRSHQDIEIKRIDSNMITSHAVRSDGLDGE